MHLPIAFSIVVNKAMKYYVSVAATIILSCAFAAAQGALPSISPTTGQDVPDNRDNKDDRYRIGLQDTLEVQVFRHPELTRRVNVNPNGTISLFRLDDPIIAICKTEDELAQDIQKAYAKDYLRDPQVGVVAVEQKSQSIAVIGAVKTPGNFYISRQVQLLQAIAFAGGPDMDHAGTRLIVFRSGSTTDCKANAMRSDDQNSAQLLSYNLRDVQEGKETLWMKPGDIVSVLDADQVFVYGNVNEQQAVKMQGPLTLTRAIILAKGLRSATDMSNIRVLRQKAGSAEREELVYNFKDIVKGNAPDPFLEPDDIVAVSQDKTQSIVNSIGRSLTNGLPSIFYRLP
jgi:polysaccharide export outer membrane protein